MSRSGSTSRVTHSFGSDKLYICLSNKCFKVYPVYSLCTDVRPSQDHRTLRMQTVRINLALFSGNVVDLPCWVLSFNAQKRLWEFHCLQLRIKIVVISGSIGKEGFKDFLKGRQKRRFFQLKSKFKSFVLQVLIQQIKKTE